MLDSPYCLYVPNGSDYALQLYEHMHDERLKARPHLPPRTMRGRVARRGHRTMLVTIVRNISSYDAFPRRTMLATHDAQGILGRAHRRTLWASYDEVGASYDACDPSYDVGIVRRRSSIVRCVMSSYDALANCTMRASYDVPERRRMSCFHHRPIMRQKALSSACRVVTKRNRCF